MHFIMSLIGFFLLLILAVVAFVALKIYSGVHRLRQAMKKGGGSGGDDKRYSGRTQYSSRTTRTSDGTTIIDQRDPNVANKKISTCTVEKLLSTCHPIADSALCHPPFHFSVNHSGSNNRKRSTPIF